VIPFSRSVRVAILLGLAATAVAVALYVSSFRHLAAARDARRNDNCAAADSRLAACWRLPGLAGAVAMEEELLGVQQGDLRDEEAWRSRSARSSPDGVLILEALAKGNLATFQFNEARTYAEAILERQPGHAHALWLRGRAWVRLQQEDKARADFEQAVSAEPEAFEIRLSLAELLHKLGYVREAIAHYERLHPRRPDDERVTVALAHCWQEQGQLDDARGLLDALLTGRPDSLAALVERGRVALRMGQPEDGERWLKRAMDLSPDHADANFVMRLCWQGQEKSDEALERRIDENGRTQAELRLKLHDSGREPTLLTEFGRWIMRTADEREAAGWFYAALKEDSAYVPAHAALAEFFQRAGQARRANKHARLAGVSLAVATQDRSALASARLADSPRKVVGEAHSAEAMSEDVHRVCAACHAYPPPDTMPRAVWRKEVKQGYDLLRSSTLHGEFPPLEDVVLYYEQHAPQRLPMIQQSSGARELPVKFEKKGTGWMVNLPPYPGAANVNLAWLLGGQKQELLLCDTRLDRVLVLKPYESSPGGQALPQVIAPSHTAVADLDGDGRLDVLVAGLGNFYPTDDKVGKVVWMRRTPEGGFEATTLLEGVGRVSDVQAADFSGDGRLDLVVAVFGWRTTGEILYLENRTTDWSRPDFKPHKVDARHGAIHVPVVDLNRDQRPDFVALISQEHETVVAYLNQGNGAFRPETIFTAPHPTFGSSGIEVVDLDSDGDSDMLLTNGDVLDRPYLLKPYHGVQWLENEEVFPFKHHLLTPMYGASRAVAADFDGDRDLDVAAVSFLPRLEFPERESLRLPSVVLLEQQAKRQFAMHVLEVGACDHFSCAAGDWDGDGKVDLAVGNFSWKRSQAFADAAVLWRNVSGE
jgi:tetratricopeptide (TPR) repeat protein/cytochrome c5